MDIYHEVETALHHGGSKLLSMQDISNWQGPKAPERVAKNEVLAIKASQGNYFLDPDFGNNWKFAEDNEKGRLAYHFFSPSIPAIQQVHFFLDQVDRFGWKNGDLIACDAEVSEGLDPAEVDAGVKEFCDLVAEQTRANPWVYTNLFFANTGNLEHLGNRPLWIADPSSPPGRPRVPAPWDNWTAHQYGIVRGIDADAINAETVEGLVRYGVLLGPAPKPPEVVTLKLTDGAAVSDHEFHEDQTLKELRGFTLSAGTGKVEFE